MESRLIKKWVSEGLKPSSFEFFTRREKLVIGKLPEKDAEVEYECPYCGYYEIKTIKMEKSGKKFKRPKFQCSSCKKTILVPDLKKV